MGLTSTGSALQPGRRILQKIGSAYSSSTGQKEPWKLEQEPCTVSKVPCTVSKCPCTVSNCPCTVSKCPWTVSKCSFWHSDLAPICGNDGWSWGFLLTRYGKCRQAIAVPQPQLYSFACLTSDPLSVLCLIPGPPPHSHLAWQHTPSARCA